MKKLFILAILALPLFSNAQRKEKIQRGTTFSGNSTSVHTHDGFYLSMALGAFFDNISDKATMASTPPQYADVTFDGSGAEFDIKIGGAIAENFILHATLVSSAIAEPKITVNGKGYSAPGNLAIGESLLGIGATYYLMPTNFFGSASFGLGRFSMTDDTDSYITERGFGMQLKVGKEWWVGRNWGLGVGVTYGKTVLTSTDDSQVYAITEKFNSNHFGILFNATFN
jgi:hypothetical protein